MERSGEELLAANMCQEFPLKDHKDLTQMISFPSEDEHNAEDIVCSKVCILPYERPSDKKCSSLVKFKNEVDYNWEEKFYNGQLVAVHRKGTIYAYAINGTGHSKDGIVRIATKLSSSRLLLKGMKGHIQDLSFASYDSEIQLAVVDESGNLFVYQVYEIANDMRSRLILEVSHDVLPRKGSSHRVVWVPYLPDSNEDEEGSLQTWNVLALLLGSKAELWDIAEASKQYGSKPLDPGSVSEGLLVVEGHTDVITEATFSPDGTALATISLDGTMQFFQVYFHEQTRCLHNWKPHDGKPLSCVFFLDDHKSDSPESQFWKFVVTGTQGNTELKVWDCKAWSHIQTVNITDSSQNLKAAIDPTSSFLLLSDQFNQVLYLFRVCVDKNDTAAYLQSVSMYVVPFPILSFTLVDATTRLVKRSSFDVNDYQEIDDDEDTLDDDDVVEEITLISLYLVQPKSLQNCQLQVLSPPPGTLLSFSTLVPIAKPPHPINLLTPKEFTSPAKPPDLESAPLIVKAEMVDILASGGSSPSREVRDILSSHEKEDPAEVEACENEVSVQEWPVVPPLPPIPQVLQPIGDTSQINKRESLGVSEIVLENIAAVGGDIRDSSDVSMKLDSVIALLHNQETVIMDLKKRLWEQENEWKHSQERLERILDDQAVVMKNQLARSEAQDRDRRENMLTAVSQTLENLIAVKLEEIVPMEIRKNVLPEILSDLEPLKHSLHVEMTQQLSATDHLLKENISKLVQSKSVMEVLGQSIVSAMRSSIPEIFKDLLGNFFLPRLEKVLEKTFHQVHETFTSGTRECLARLTEDVSKVNFEMNKSEKRLKAVAELNKDAIHAFQAELQKSVLNVGDKLQKQMSETIQKEMLASRAPTPIVPDKQMIVAKLLAAGQINAAFQEALSASDLDLVVFVCDKIAAEVVFAKSPCPLEQPVLLSLVQQLSADMANHTDLKCSYLTEAVLCLEENHPTTKEHLPVVISEVHRHITSYLATHPGGKHSREMQRILQVIKILTRGK